MKFDRGVFVERDVISLSQMPVPSQSFYRRRRCPFFEHEESITGGFWRSLPHIEPWMCPGGSTITQQIAKSSFSPERSYAEIKRSDFGQASSTT